MASPPMAPGEKRQRVVAFAVIVSGSVDSFDRNRFKAALSRTLEGVTEEQISLNVTAASIRVGVEILLSGDAATGATGIVSQIANLTSNLRTLSEALGVNVESIAAAPAVRDKVIPAALGFGDSDGANAGAIVGGVFGGLFLLIVLFLCISKKHRERLLRALGRKPSSEANSSDVRLTLTPSSAVEAEVDSGAAVTPLEPAVPLERSRTDSLSNLPGIAKDFEIPAGESPEEHERRLEWIRYYVSEKHEERAKELGWDGQPFRRHSSKELWKSAKDVIAQSKERKKESSRGLGKASLTPTDTPIPATARNSLLKIVEAQNARSDKKPVGDQFQRALSKPLSAPRAQDPPLGVAEAKPAPANDAPVGDQQQSQTVISRTSFVPVGEQARPQSRSVTSTSSTSLAPLTWEKKPSMKTVGSATLAASAFTSTIKSPTRANKDREPARQGSSGSCSSATLSLGASLQMAKQQTSDLQSLNWQRPRSLKPAATAVMAVKAFTLPKLEGVTSGVSDPEASVSKREVKAEPDAGPSSAVLNLKPLRSGSVSIASLPKLESVTSRGASSVISLPKLEGTTRGSITRDPPAET